MLVPTPMHTEPPPPDDDEPVLSVKQPLSLAAAPPLATDTSPLLVLDELEPTHTDPLLAIADPPPDTHVTAPPLPSDASPPLTHTLPPAPTPAPPSSETLPPDAHCEAVSPALTRTSAPPPADTATLPLVPAAELPLAIDTLPLEVKESPDVKATVVVDFICIAPDLLNAFTDSP